MAFDPDQYINSLDQSSNNAGTKQTPSNNSSSFNPDDFIHSMMEKNTEDVPLMANGELVDETGYHYDNKPDKPDNSLTDVVAGGLETALTMGTGATTGAAGYIYGAAKGLLQRALGDASAKDVENMANEYAELLTVMPNTKLGQQYTQAIGEALSIIPPVVGAMPIVGPSATSQAINAVKPIAPDIVKTVKAVPENIRDRSTINREEAAFKRSTGMKPEEVIKAMDEQQANSKNTAGSEVLNDQDIPDRDNPVLTPDELIRANERIKMARELPIPIKLSKGQATQKVAQQKSERELAKLGLGEDLQNHYLQNNQDVLANVDYRIAQNGSKFSDNSNYETGQVIYQALDDMQKKDKVAINKAYKKANSSPQAKQQINFNGFSRWMNRNFPRNTVNVSILRQVQKEAERMGIATGDIDNQTFRIKNNGRVTVKQAEQLRQFINTVNAPDPNTRELAKMAKTVIDGQVKKSGGRPYALARQLRHQYGKNYEDPRLISQLLSTVKPWSNENKIPFEDFTKKAVKNGSKQDLINAKKVLSRTPQGKQAWQELGAQTLKDLKESAIKQAGLDEWNNEKFSAPAFGKSIKKLDRSGKLDLLFGQDVAKDLRSLSTIADTIMISQQGAVNHSNTASTIFALAIDAAITTMVMPSVTATGANAVRIIYARQKTKNLIKDALEFDKTIDLINKGKEQNKN